MNKIDYLKLNNKEENTILSPYSLMIALSMLYEGATGETKEELDRLLSDEDIYKYANIQDVLCIFNKIYVDKSISNSISQDFLDNLNTKYNAELEVDALDVDVINSYVEKKTFGQIKNILDKINGNLLLINTIAVDMQWENEVSPTKVNKGIFNDNIEASYIYGFQGYNSSYYEDDYTIALGLNLKKYFDQFDCVLIQPKNISLTEYINGINDDNIYHILNNLQPLKDDPREIHISVPKFSFEYSLNAMDSLRQMGFKTIDSPNLQKIINDRCDLNVIHKSKIDFSEKGLKAASATIMEMLCGCAFPVEREKLYININKPFIFAVRDKATNTIFFMGTVYKPVLWRDDSVNYQWK